MNNAILLIALLSLLTCIGCKMESNGELQNSYTAQLTFEPVVGTQPFVLNTSYTNAFNESYRVQKLLFYISNIQLSQSATGAKEAQAESYHLVDMANESSKAINVPVTSNTYNTLTFTIGVDSVRNVSGAQTGALDPLNGMFWTWNSGYIMAKLEGTSPASTAANNGITHHIGGYKVANSAIRTLTIPLPNGALNTRAGGTTVLHLKVDVHKWFSGVHNLPIATVNNLMSTGTTAMQLADNYASMISLTSVENK